MLLIGLILLSLVLVGIVGLQFTYMFYLDRLHLERKKHIHDLERRCIGLTTRLEKTEKRLAEQNALIETAYPGTKIDDEMWADVIDER